MGIVPDSTVAIYSPNHVDYFPITMVVALCGAKAMPINSMYTAQELTVVLERSGTSVLACHTSTLDVALEAARYGEKVKHVVVVTDSKDETVPEGTVSLDAIRNQENGLMATLGVSKSNTSTHSVVLPYSSGTTGLPKGVCLTHENIVANLLQCELAEASLFPNTRSLITPLPFFHIYALTVGMFYSAWKGHTVITSSGRFDLEQFCQTVEKYKPERSHLVPPILLGLAKHPLVDKYDISSLKMIVSAAAPLGQETEAAVKTRLGCKVKQAWGMSKLSPIGTINPDDKVRAGSVGPPVSSTLAKIIDEEGNSLGPNEDGEFLLKGPQVMMGYLDSDTMGLHDVPEKTAQCLSTSGWLRTGDLAHYDDDGYFCITDRVKELIKVRGFPVAPAELEALLLTHPAVADAAVIRVPVDESGELPRAHVFIKADEESQKTTDEDVSRFVEENVAAYKRLKGGATFVDAVPKSASGTILRRLLRDMAAAE